MKHTAHVVLRIETRGGGEPPTVTGVSVFSAPWRDIELIHKPWISYADAQMAEGDSFAAARQLLMKRLRGYPGTVWMADWIERGARGAGG